MAEGRSVWFWIGIGCLGVFVVGAIFVVGAGLWAYRSAKRFQAELEDPDARTAKVLRILHGDSVPEGYHAVVGFSVPFVMDVAILSDKVPAKGDHDLGDRSLIYVQIVRTGQDEKGLRDYFEGKTSDPDILRENNIDVDIDEIVGRGVFELNGATLMYLAQRGSIRTGDYSGSGLSSIVLIDCPEDKRTRMAIWITPDERAGTPAAEADWTGTTADPDEIAEFLGGFRFCAQG
jgi:hypothetical protein